MSSAFERGEDNACLHATNNPPLDSWTKPLQASSSAFPLERLRNGHNAEKSRSFGSRIDVSVTTWRSSPSGLDSVLSRLGCVVMSHEAQTPKRAARRTPTTSFGRRFSKVDSYAWLDIRRDHDLPFAAASFLRMVTELADHWSRTWTGTITELHEQTGMARKTISAYLEQLDSEGLIVVLERAHGSRPGRIDVSRHYDELIVPNQREQRAAATQKAAAADEPPLDTDCVSSASSLSQMTRPTRENTDLGGIEAIEEEKVHDSQSDANGLRSFYEASVELWKGTKIREVFDSALLDSGFDPFGCWWVEAETTGAGHQLRELLESIHAGFEDF